MGVEVDSLYKQNLTEWVYDEQKLITYRYLSVTLGVHVNIAKQMLYEFYNDERKKEKQKRNESNNNTIGTGIQALFYISGLKTNSSEVGGATSAFVSTICRDDQVESIKKGFRKISSVHIYSLQLLQLENNDIIDKLSNTLQEMSLLAHEVGRSAVDFGPFKLQVATKINPVPKAPAPTVSAPVTKAGVKSKPFEVVKKPDVKQSIFGRSNSKIAEKPTVKEEEKSQTADKEKPTSSTPKSNESSTKKNAGNQNDRLKNMFAAAASKPKKPPQAMIVDSEEESPEASRVVKKEPPPKTYGRNNARNKYKAKEVEATRKRKRVVDILSSSEEEEEEETRPLKRTIRISSDEEDSLPESPIPRKRAPVIIDSDSESDMFQSPKKKEKGKLNFVPKPKEKSPPPESSGSGRRKVKKTITKSHIDEDGFTVTTKTQEWVSASESDEEKKAEKTPQKPDKSTQGIVNDKEKKAPFSFTTGGAKKAVASVPSPVKNISASTPTNTKKTSGASGPKTKQPTLMSFFTKKT